MMRKRKIWPAIALELLIVAASHTSATSLDPAALQSAADYSADHHGTSCLVIQKGKTLLEEHSGRSNAATPERIYSGTKAFWNLAALAAAEDGILDLDERVADTIPGWRKDPRKAQVTIRPPYLAGPVPSCKRIVDPAVRQAGKALEIPVTRNDDGRGSFS